MKNRVIIFWLIFFFPLGLLLMFHQTDWDRKIKFSITGFYSLIAVGIVLLGIWSQLLFVSSVFIFLIGIIMLIYSFFRKTDKRNSLSVLALSVIIMFGIGPTINAQLEEEAAIQAEQERQEELVLAQQKKEAQRMKVLSGIEEQQTKADELKDKTLLAIEKVEEKPTILNYERAEKLFLRLILTDDELEDRLAEAKIEVDAYEEKLAKATEVLEKAEENEERTSYEKADKLIGALVVPNSGLTDRLEVLDEKIVEREKEEKLAAEKAEKERKEKEKEAEEKRIAAERKAEEKRIAAEKKAEKKKVQEASSNQGNTSSTSSNQGGGQQYVDQNGNGLIKGSKNKIYHVPGSTYYNRTTNPARMFKTIEEAENAGYRAPKR